MARRNSQFGDILEFPVSREIRCLSPNCHSAAVLRPFALRILVFLLAVLTVWAGGPGFRSPRQLEAHYRKHGREFGSITKLEYLRMAQELRDAPRTRDILEARREGGVVTKFDRRRGWFGAYNIDGTIRTFFIPVAGESYFRRQSRR